MNQEKHPFDINNVDDKKRLYHFLAMLNNFIEKNDTIYKNKKGDKFILTRYGFRPVDEYNIQTLYKEQSSKLELVEQKNKEYKKKIENLKKENERLQELAKKVKATNVKLSSQKSAYCSCGGLMSYKMYEDYILAYCAYCSN